MLRTRHICAETSSILWNKYRKFNHIIMNVRSVATILRDHVHAILFGLSVIMLSKNAIAMGKYLNLLS